MSDYSSDSGSSQKGFLKRMLKSDQSNKAKQSNVGQRHPVFSTINNALNPQDNVSKSHETVMSSATKKLNKDGFEVYNVSEKQEVYVTIQPDNAFFEEDEPQMIRMEPGNFVSNGHKESASDALPKFASVKGGMKYEQPADLFQNALRRDDYDDIDFTEIIIKSNDNYEKEIAEVPLFDPSGGEDFRFEEVNMTSQKMEESAVVSTSTAKPIANMEVRSFVEYYEEPTYKVEIEEPEAKIPSYIEMNIAPQPTYREEPKVVEVFNEPEVFESPVVPEVKVTEIHEIPVEPEVKVTEVLESPVVPEVKVTEVHEAKEPAREIKTASFVEKYEEPIEEEVVDVVGAPAGLHVEGNEPTNEACIDADEKEDLSAFVQTGFSEAVALTSEAAPKVIEWNPGTFIQDVQALPQPEVLLIPEVVSEDTAASLQQFIEIEDPVGDLLKLTVPELFIGEAVIEDLMEDAEIIFPDDGLESYDAKFAVLQSISEPITAGPSVSFGFDGFDEDMHGPSLNFRF